MDKKVKVRFRYAPTFSLDFGTVFAYLLNSHWCCRNPYAFAMTFATLDTVNPVTLYYVMSESSTVLGLCTGCCTWMSLRCQVVASDDK